MASNALETMAVDLKRIFFASKIKSKGADRLWRTIEDAVNKRPHHALLQLHNMALHIEPTEQLFKLMSINDDLRNMSSRASASDRMRQVIVTYVMYLIITDPETIERIEPTHYELNQGPDGLYTGYIAPHCAYAQTA